MFGNGEELLKICKSKDKHIWEITLLEEMKNTNVSEKDIWEKTGNILSVMGQSSTEGLNKEMKSMGGLIGRESLKVEEYRKSGKKTFSSDFVLSAVAKAFSTSQVNAGMGKIVAAPTAGAAGIMPAILFSAKDKLNLTEDKLIQGLLTSAGVGELIASQATISGAEGGCQAECGAAAAMGAAALVEMSGGSPEQALDAASFALTNIMGLVCDPIAGLVEYPCTFRNASGVTNAFLSADLALAEIKSLVPFDQVVQAMYEVGNQMHFSLKETALGGLATTKAGEKIRESLK